MSKLPKGIKPPAWYRIIDEVVENLYLEVGKDQPLSVYKNRMLINDENTQVMEAVLEQIAIECPILDSGELIKGGRG